MAHSEYDLGEAVGRIEAKIDILIDAKTDHDKRLKSLEKTRQYITGFIAAATALLTFKATA